MSQGQQRQQAAAPAAQQQQQRTQRATPEVREEISENAFRELLKKEVTYVPFGEQEPITLKFSEVRNVVAKRTKGGHLPTDADIYTFMRLCQARGLNPFVGDAYLVGYDTNDGPVFSLITAIQALFKRAEVHPAFDGLVYGIIVQDGDKDIVERIGDFRYPGDTLLGAWATCYRKDRTHQITDRINFSTFDTGQSRWKKDPAGMIVKCAQASVLRTAFPSQIGQLYIDEEFQQTLATGLSESGGRVNANPADLKNLMGVLERSQAAARPSTQTAVREAVSEAFANDAQPALTPLQKAIAEISQADNQQEARDTYDRLFGPDSSLSWSPDDDKAAVHARDVRLAELS